MTIKAWVLRTRRAMVAKLETLANIVALSQRPEKPTKAKKIGPTPERARKGKHESMGMARRFVPMIDTLLRNKVITESEHRALGYFRDQASLAERSPVKSCLDFTPGGGRGPGVAIISAQRETHRMERDMGPLASLVRAVAVDDYSLNEWCASRFGSEFAKMQISIAALELKYAAGAIIQPE